MSDKAWKAQERAAAAALGGHRNPNNGRAQSDIDAGGYAVEHKARRRLPQWLTRALGQARDSADGRVPLVVLSEVRQGVRAQRYVILRLGDWLALVNGPDSAEALADGGHEVQE